MHLDAALLSQFRQAFANASLVEQVKTSVSIELALCSVSTKMRVANTVDL